MDTQPLNFINISYQINTRRAPENLGEGDERLQKEVIKVLTKFLMKANRLVGQGLQGLVRVWANTFRARAAGQACPVSLQQEQLGSQCLTLQPYLQGFNAHVLTYVGSGYTCTLLSHCSK